MITARGSVKGKISVRGTITGTVNNASYDSGYKKGSMDSKATWYEKGKEEGYEEGEQKGYDAGHAAGAAEGYSTGHAEGLQAGYNTGHEEGIKTGYNTGYEEGRKNNEFFEAFMNRSFIEFESETDKPIRYGMFRNCKQLVEVSCPNVPLVEHEAFRFDSKLQEVNLPSVTQLDPYAFAGCTKLETLNLPSIKILKGNTLNQCTSLKNFPYFGQIEEIGGYEFRQCPIEKKAWEFENLTKISAQYAFSEASAEVIILRKAVNNGMDRSFHGAPNLRIVDLHKAFQLGRYNFQNSPNLEAVILRDEEKKFSFKNVDIFESNTNFYFYVPAKYLEDYKNSTNASAHPDRFRTLDLERLAWYAPSRVLWLDSECNAETGHADGVTELFDLSKNGYNATITGTLTYDDGYVFDGNAANYLTIPATPVLDRAEEITYEMVWNLAGISGTQRLLFSSGFQMYMTAGVLRCDCRFDGDPKEKPEISAITGLVSVAITFKSNESLKFYVNGVEIQSFDAGINSAKAPTFYVGQGGGINPAASGNKFLAFRAYSRALTADEILNNYQLDAGRWGVAND